MKLPNNIQLMRVIENTNTTDYDLVGEYHRIDECCEVLRLNNFGTVKDFPKPYVLNNKIYFGIKETMNPFYMAEATGDKFKLYELSYKKYNELGF